MRYMKGECIKVKDTAGAGTIINLGMNMKGIGIMIWNTDLVYYRVKFNKFYFSDFYWNIKTEIFTKDIGKIILRMDRVKYNIGKLEYKFLVMGIFLKANLLTIKRMDKELWLTKMKVFTKEIGKTTWDMDLGDLPGFLETGVNRLFKKDNGLMINLFHRYND